jgi:KDO2-lipid IV(A) lauroyltransferase
MLKHLAFRVFMPVLGRFPALFYPLAGLAGWLAFHLNRRSRRNVISNLRPACRSYREAERQALNAFKNVARYYVDLATTPHHDTETFERDHLTLINEDRLSALFDPGPVILLGAHAGNPELGLIAVAARGRPFVELVEPLAPRKLASYVATLREAGGGRVIETDTSGLRTAFRTLRKGGLVAIMGDRDIQGSGVCVSMFDRRVLLPRGPWELAQRTGARVVPLLLTRGASAGATVRVEETIPVAGNGHEAIENAAQCWASLLETHIRREPGQWVVLEDFWKVHGCGKG